MKRKAKSRIDPRTLLATVRAGKSVRDYRKNEQIFAQGDRAEVVFFVERGKVKLTVLSQQGKQAVIAILGPGNFFGEGCLAGQPVRMGSATAITPSAILRVEKAQMVRLLHRQHDMSDRFIAHMLTRNIRIEEDLIDQLFNSSEKRLARLLLLLANFGKEGTPQPIAPHVSQETLAEMIGTTRSRVSFFMNKFRKLGFISYNGKIEVHSSLLNAVLRDKSEIDRKD